MRFSLGLHLRHGRKPDCSASAGVGKNRTCLIAGRLAGQEGLQYTPVDRTANTKSPSKDRFRLRTASHFSLSVNTFGWPRSAMDSSIAASGVAEDKICAYIATCQVCVVASIHVRLASWSARNALLSKVECQCRLKLNRMLNSAFALLFSFEGTICV